MEAFFRLLDDQGAQSFGRIFDLEEDGESRQDQQEQAEGDGNDFQEGFHWAISDSTARDGQPAGESLRNFNNFTGSTAKSSGERHRPLKDRHPGES